MLPDVCDSPEKSLNLEKMPFFLGLTSSSSSPTSSNFSSSIASGFENPFVCEVDGDVIRETRESSEVREGIVSV